MALSNAERQRRYREKLKRRVKASTGFDQVQDAVSEYIDAWWSEQGSASNGNDEIESAEQETAECLASLKDKIRTAADYWLDDYGFKTSTGGEPEIINAVHSLLHWAYDERKPKRDSTTNTGKNKPAAEQDAQHQDDDSGHQEPPARPASRGMGVRCAHKAINALKSMPHNDPTRHEAYRMVEDWIETFRSY